MMRTALAWIFGWPLVLVYAIAYVLASSSHRRMHR